MKREILLPYLGAVLLNTVSNQGLQQTHAISFAIQLAEIRAAVIAIPVTQTTYTTNDGASGQSAGASSTTLAQSAWRQVWNRPGGGYSRV
jgi:hypothetical protein